MCDNGPESGAVVTGLDSGSLNGVGGYDEAILQNGHGGGAVESMMGQNNVFIQSECGAAHLC